MGNPRWYSWSRLPNGIEIEGVVLPAQEVHIVPYRASDPVTHWIEGYIPLENRLWVEVAFFEDEESAKLNEHWWSNGLQLSLLWRPEDEQRDDKGWGWAPVLIEKDEAVRQTQHGVSELKDVEDPREIFEVLRIWGSLRVIDSQFLRTRLGTL